LSNTRTVMTYIRMSLRTNNCAHPSSIGGRGSTTRFTHTHPNGVARISSEGCLGSVITTNWCSYVRIPCRFPRGRSGSTSGSWIGRIASCWSRTRSRTSTIPTFICTNGATSAREGLGTPTWIRTILNTKSIKALPVSTWTPCPHINTRGLIGCTQSIVAHEWRTACTFFERVARIIRRRALTISTSHSSDTGVDCRTLFRCHHASNTICALYRFFGCTRHYNLSHHGTSQGRHGTETILTLIRSLRNARIGHNRIGLIKSTTRTRGGSTSGTSTIPTSNNTRTATIRTNGA
jgi:hypothetical protein